MITLTNIQEVIERSIFESIRRALVELGYLPDILNYEDSEAGVTQYEIDLTLIALNKGFSIEVFSESSNFSKGIKKVPRLVLKTGNFLPGAIGGDPSKYFVPDDIGFSALTMPPQTADFFIDIHLVSNNVSQERILNAIVSNAVPRRKYLKYYNNENLSFFINHINFHELDDNGSGIIEKVHSYEIPDCWDIDDTLLEVGVSKITRIDMNIKLQKYMDGTFGSDTNTITVYSSLKASINTNSLVNAHIGI